MRVDTRTFAMATFVAVAISISAPLAAAEMGRPKVGATFDMTCTGGKNTGRIITVEEVSGDTLVIKEVFSGGLVRFTKKPYFWNISTAYQEQRREGKDKKKKGGKLKSKNMLGGIVNLEVGSQHAMELGDWKFLVTVKGHEKISIGGFTDLDVYRVHEIRKKGSSTIQFTTLYSPKLAWIVSFEFIGTKGNKISCKLKGAKGFE
ncbi:MAG: hypothetical protein IH998_09120 [Proteobacteria bacterium]|nr:hypothetical protein [Pseudomonadota bacterium]